MSYLRLTLHMWNIIMTEFSVQTSSQFYSSFSMHACYVHTCRIHLNGYMYHGLELPNNGHNSECIWCACKLAIISLQAAGHRHIRGDERQRGVTSPVTCIAEAPRQSIGHRFGLRLLVPFLLLPFSWAVLSCNLYSGSQYILMSWICLNVYSISPLTST